MVTQRVWCCGCTDGVGRSTVTDPRFRYARATPILGAAIRQFGPGFPPRRSSLATLATDGLAARNGQGLPGHARNIACIGPGKCHISGPNFILFSTYGKSAICTVPKGAGDRGRAVWRVLPAPVQEICLARVPRVSIQRGLLFPQRRGKVP